MDNHAHHKYILVKAALHLSPLRQSQRDIIPGQRLEAISGVIMAKAEKRHRRHLTDLLRDGSSIYLACVRWKRIRKVVRIII